LGGNRQIAVFSKTYCPYCRATKLLLQEHTAQYDGDAREQALLTQTIVELNLMPEKDGMEVQGALEYMTGQRTVPNVFINSVQMGGNSDMEYLAGTGELAARLHAVLEMKHDADL